MLTTEKQSLKRPRHSMPDFVRDTLLRHGLMEIYRQCPPYQQNDYVGWINRTKQDETKAQTGTND